MPFNVTPDWPQPERLNGNRCEPHALTKARPTDKRMYAIRLGFVSVLAVIGGGAWLELVCPTLLAERMRVATPELWYAVFIVLIAMALEWIWHRRLMRRLTEYQAMPRSDSRG